MGDTWLALQRLREHRVDGAQSELRARVLRAKEQLRRTRALEAALTAERAATRETVVGELTRGDELRISDLQALGAFREAASRRLNALEGERATAERAANAAAADEESSRAALRAAHVEARVVERFNQARKDRALLAKERAAEDDAGDNFLARRV